MELKHSLSIVPMLLYHWSHAHLLTELVIKEEDILHLPEHLLLTLGMILPLMVFCSRMQHIIFLSVPHMVQILKNLFSLFRWFQLLYMGPVSPCSCLYFWFNWVHCSSSKVEDSSRHIHLDWIQRFTCTVSGSCCIEEPIIDLLLSLRGGIFPLSFSSFPWLY